MPLRIVGPTKVSRYHVLWERLQKELPGIRTVPRKSNWLFKHFPKKFDNFGTTINNTLYLPMNWDTRSEASKYRHIRHEVVHFRQFRRWPFAFLGKFKRLRYINTILFSLTYLLLPLPVFWTARSLFERKSYEQSLATAVEIGELDPFSEAHEASWTEWAVETFTSGTYVWMSTEKSTRKWCAKAFAKARDGHLGNIRDKVVL